VRRYLIQQRGLSATILASLIDQGKLYADTRGNAVFVMMAGKPNRPIGAELRGTGRRVWRGLAPGTCKKHRLLLDRRSRRAAHRPLRIRD
jgi:hypothetical protein